MKRYFIIVMLSILFSWINLQLLLKVFDGTPGILFSILIQILFVIVASYPLKLLLSRTVSVYVKAFEIIVYIFILWVFQLYVHYSSPSPQKLIVQIFNALDEYEQIEYGDIYVDNYRQEPFVIVTQYKFYNQLPVYVHKFRIVDFNNNEREYYLEGKKDGGCRVYKSDSLDASIEHDSIINIKNLDKPYLKMLKKGYKFKVLEYDKNSIKSFKHLSHPTIIKEEKLTGWRYPLFKYLRFFGYKQYDL